MGLKRSTEKEEFENLLVQNRRKEKVKKEHVDVNWLIKIVVIAFTISFVLSFVSQTTIPKLSIFLGVIVTLLFIVIGIIFDIVGVAVNSADEKVFHSMNSRKVKGSKVAVLFKKNADKVSSFCNDVIGDICGIISGAAGTTIAVGLADKLNVDLLFVNLTVAAIIAALTIGGKAMGKSFAMNKSDIILYEFAKIVSIFYKG
jgi:CBS domain containing-hemolysin-like protein